MKQVELKLKNWLHLRQWTFKEHDFSPASPYKKRFRLRDTVIENVALLNFTSANGKFIFFFILYFYFLFLFIFIFFPMGQEFSEYTIVKKCEP